MKKLLLSCLGICLFSSVSFVYADCIRDCMDNGYNAFYCRQVCYPSLPVPPSPNQVLKSPKIDPNCYNDCRSKGYSSGYCKEECSYDD